MIINKTYYPFDIKTRVKIVNRELIPISLRRLILKDRNGKETIIPQALRQPIGKICYVRIYPYANIAGKTHDFVEIPEYCTTREEILQTEAKKGDNNIIVFLDELKAYMLWYYTQWINGIHYIGNY